MLLWMKFRFCVCSSCRDVSDVAVRPTGRYTAAFQTALPLTASTPPMNPTTAAPSVRLVRLSQCSLSVQYFGPWHSHSKPFIFRISLKWAVEIHSPNRIIHVLVPLWSSLLHHSYLDYETSSDFQLACGIGDKWLNYVFFVNCSFMTLQPVNVICSLSHHFENLFLHLTTCLPSIHGVQACWKLQVLSMFTSQEQKDLMCCHTTSHNSSWHTHTVKLMPLACVHIIRGLFFHSVCSSCSFQNQHWLHHLTHPAAYTVMSCVLSLPLAFKSTLVGFVCVCVCVCVCQTVIAAGITITHVWCAFCRIKWKKKQQPHEHTICFSYLAALW